MGFSPFKEPEKSDDTGRNRRQKRLDDAYKSATNKIPDQQSSDPWATFARGIGRGGEEEAASDTAGSRRQS